MKPKIIEARIPSQLFTELEALVEEGWFRDIDDLLVDALRRYLDSHHPELMEQFIRQDLEWGLYGEE